jgi:hypothetical protein
MWIRHQLYGFATASCVPVTALLTWRRHASAAAAQPARVLRLMRTLTGL